MIKVLTNKLNCDILTTYKNKKRNKQNAQNNKYQNKTF